MNGAGGARRSMGFVPRSIRATGFPVDGPGQFAAARPGLLVLDHAQLQNGAGNHAHTQGFSDTQINKYPRTFAHTKKYIDEMEK